MKFKYLDHTSEAKFQAFGKTLEEAFGNAGLAVSNIMTKVEEINNVKKKEIRIKSKSLKSLLYDFIDEIVYFADADHFFIGKFENIQIKKNKEYTLTSTVLGNDASNCIKGSEVKAPTYDDMKIEETKEGWMVQVVVDV